jgi:uncharacterized protein (DUF302 family)
MPTDMVSIQYSLAEPFERAVECVCSSLTSRGSRIVGQFDISRRVERGIGMVLSPCRIIFVLPHRATLTTHGMHPWSAMFLPLHVVICDKGTRTEIQAQGRIHHGSIANEPASFGPVVAAQVRIWEAIEAVAMRPSIIS